MAQGAVTVEFNETFGTRNIVVGSIELSAAYPSGGIAVSAAALGLSSLDFLIFETVELAATTALVPRYDYATGKVMLHEGDGPTTAGPLAETDEALTNATDLRFLAIGRK